MDKVKQFETMATIRAYALEISRQMPDDQRPSTAQSTYVKIIARMSELARLLETRS